MAAMRPPLGVQASRWRGTRSARVAARQLVADSIDEPIHLFKKHTEYTEPTTWTWHAPLQTGVT
jgi:hypothetical protein